MNFTRSRVTGLIFLTGLLIAVAALGLMVGTVSISPGTVWEWLCGGTVDSQAELILGGVRLPRLLVGALCGAALAISGMVMQVWTANPLAGPGLLGLNGGASAALAVAVAFFPWLRPELIIVIGIAGAAAGGLMVLAALYVTPASDHPLRLVLVGAMVSAVLSSLTATLIIVSGMQTDLLFWMVGGLGVVGWREVACLAVAVSLGVILLLFVINDLAVAALDNSVAQSLGVRSARLRVWLGILVVVLTGTANAVAGPLGFIGFLAPHLVRWRTGPDPRVLLLPTAVMGATLVVCADAIGRVVTRPTEQPLGVFLALVGAPALVYVALNQRRTSS